jgi:hypothetical protein
MEDFLLAEARSKRHDVTIARNESRMCMYVLVYVLVYGLMYVLMCVYNIYVLLFIHV